jgi:hypothetical protein
MSKDAEVRIHIKIIWTVMSYSLVKLPDNFYYTEDGGSRSLPIVSIPL